MDLYSYIKNCAADYEEYLNQEGSGGKEFKKKNYFNDKVQLYDAIFNLMDELHRRAKKVTAVDYNSKKFKPTFFTMYEDESEMECMKSNLRLQKAFFTFISQIIQNFVQLLIQKDLVL